MAQAPIHIGIGGWTFPPWRGTFYPPGLAQNRELEHADSMPGAIEINGAKVRAPAGALASIGRVGR